MKPLAETSISISIARNLDRFQQQIDEIDDYPRRLSVGQSLWSQKTRSARATFRNVRDSLTLMNGDDPHCYYCGGSAARELDHFRPKSLYPDLIFVWENYLYCCGACNGFKLDKFAIFDDVDGPQFASATQFTNNFLQPPPHGPAVLIDPRKENPMAYVAINLNFPGNADHCAYRPMLGLDPRSNVRAKYTIDSLQLNRDRLLVSRQSAFAGFRDKLAQYVAYRNAGASESELGHREVAIKTERHQAVWFEIKRWYSLGWMKNSTGLENLSADLTSVPEALAW